MVARCGAKQLVALFLESSSWVGFEQGEYQSWAMVLCRNSEMMCDDTISKRLMNSL